MNTWGVIFALEMRIRAREVLNLPDPVELEEALLYGNDDLGDALIARRRGVTQPCPSLLLSLLSFNADAWHDAHTTSSASRPLLSL